jgi:hypothetical protein
LALTPAALDLGDATQPGELVLTNRGTAALTWTARPGTASIAVDRTGGTLAPGAEQRLTVNASAAPEGALAGSLTVRSTGGDVSATITARPDRPPTLTNPDVRGVLSAASPRFSWCPGDHLKILANVADLNGVASVTARYVWKPTPDAIESVWQAPMARDGSGAYLSEEIRLEAGSFVLSIEARDSTGHRRTASLQTRIVPPHVTPGFCTGGPTGSWQITP